VAEVAVAAVTVGCAIAGISEESITEDYNLQLSLEKGWANVLGVSTDDVTLTKVGTTVLARRLTGGTQVEFQIKTQNMETDTISDMTSKVSEQSANYANSVKSAAGELGVDVSALEIVEGSVASTQTVQVQAKIEYREAVIASAPTLGDCRDLASCDSDISIQSDGSVKLTTMRAQAKVITLQNAGISEIADGAFNGVVAEKLDLSKNKLKTLTAAMLAGITGLKTLDLSNNQLESIPVGTFDSLGSLTIINLNYNRLQSGSFPSMTCMLDSSHESC